MGFVHHQRAVGGQQPQLAQQLDAEQRMVDDEDVGFGWP
jgi:hypothetical protein